MVNTAKKKIQINTDYGSHLCVFKPDGDGGFIVAALGVQGVITWGKNLAHAKKMAKECLELCIECLVEKQLHKGRRRAIRITEGVSARVLYQSLLP